MYNSDNKDLKWVTPYSQSDFNNYLSHVRQKKNFAVISPVASNNKSQSSDAASNNQWTLNKKHFQPFAVAQQEEDDCSLDERFSVKLSKKTTWKNRYDKNVPMSSLFKIPSSNNDDEIGELLQTPPKLTQEKFIKMCENNNTMNEFKATTRNRRKKLHKLQKQNTFQKGKLHILTPETYSDFLGQKNENYDGKRSVIADINNSSDYPELSPSNYISNQQYNVWNTHKKIMKQENIPEISRTSRNASDMQNKDHVAVNYNQRPLEQLPVISIGTQNKNKNTKIIKNQETKLKQPMKLCDVLLFKTKQKDNKLCKSLITTLKGEEIKKNIPNQNVQKANVLDSTAPTIRRGKEREKPKQKKLTQMKKVIISERQQRKNRFDDNLANAILEEEKDIEEIHDFLNEDFQLESNNINEFTFGNKFENVEDCLEENVDYNQNAEIEEQDQYSNVDEESISRNVGCNNFNEDLNIKTYLQDREYRDFEINEAKQTAQNLIDKCSQSAVELLNQVITSSFHEHDVGENMANVCNMTGIARETTLEKIESLSESQHDATCYVVSEKSSSLNPNSSIFVPKIQIQNVQLEVQFEKFPEENTIVKNNVKLTVDVQDCVNLDEKKQAVEILIHSRHFREYCRNLLSTSLDETILELLGDLSRFQDRMHVKNPVKAHSKRRLVNGIKEVTKYVKLKKLKCIFIAPDLENIKTAGGLNDALSTLIQMASEYHIPCVFAVGRNRFGKACHKSVPVSCIGIFNYEGAETSFKKIIEMYQESTKDYKCLHDILIQNLENEDVRLLLQCRKEAPEKIYAMCNSVAQKIFTLNVQMKHNVSYAHLKEKYKIKLQIV